MSEVLAAYLAGKLVDRVVDGFAERVIQRWSRYRAGRFIESLVEGIAAGKLSEEEAGKKIDAALEHEAKSAVLFESYRRVCLSASRDLGPRFIGLLTARLLVADRAADDVEERLFMAAEILSDTDFGEFINFLRQASNTGAGPFHRYRNSAVRAIVHSETERPDTSSFHADPLNLIESHGTWALKISSVGILTQHIEQRRRHLPRTPNESKATGRFETTYTWSVGIDARFLGYLALLEQAARTEPLDVPRPSERL